MYSTVSSSLIYSVHTFACVRVTEHVTRPCQTLNCREKFMFLPWQIFPCWKKAAFASSAPASSSAIASNVYERVLPTWQVHRSGVSFLNYIGSGSAKFKYLYYWKLIGTRPSIISNWSELTDPSSNFSAIIILTHRVAVSWWQCLPATIFKSSKINLTTFSQSPPVVGFRRRLLLCDANLYCKLAWAFMACGNRHSEGLTKDLGNNHIFCLTKHRTGLPVLDFQKSGKRLVISCKVNLTGTKMFFLMHG
jgi:hypothetical protein